MPLLRLPAFASLCAASAMMASLVTSQTQAANTDNWEVWGIEGMGDVCRISLKPRRNDESNGRVKHHDKGCKIGRFKRFSIADDNAVVLMDEEDTVAIILQPDGIGRYKGLVGDGEAVEMSRMGTLPRKGGQDDDWDEQWRKDRDHDKDYSKDRDRGHPKSGDNSEVASDCITYYGKSRCADDHDKGLPGKMFDYKPIEPVVRLNHRFMASRTSSIIGQAAPRQCYETRTCTETLIDKEIWCEIKIGNRWGWVLKQDKQHVYARTSCG